MFRIIFGECDVELFQAEHQLGFVFLLQLHPLNSLMYLKIYLSSFIILPLEYCSQWKSWLSALTSDAATPGQVVLLTLLILPFKNLLPSPFPTCHCFINYWGQLYVLNFNFNYFTHLWSYTLAYLSSIIMCVVLWQCSYISFPRIISMLLV